MAQNLPADENWTVNNNPNRDYTVRLESELVANSQPNGQVQVCFLGRN
ncbi:MAG: hypothetical protein LAT62_02630 [Natronospirillum sp.]|nr:hypothetical protein [Natronospirillum sp.]MCH8550803.1 hypothetical protein [Natronospirillum sp.]